MERLTRILVGLLTCRLVAPVDSSVTTSTWCFTERTRRTISCQDKDSTLLVIRAWVGVTFESGTSFCSSPAPSPEDCRFDMEVMTDSYRKECNTFRRCSFPIQKPPVNTCGEGYTGEMYLTLEYTCQSNLDSNGQHLPFVADCVLAGITSPAPSVTLSSGNYPSDDVTVRACALKVWSETTGDVRIVIRDLAHLSDDNLSCPYYVRYDVTRRVCARRGLDYTTLSVRHGSKIDIVANATRPVGRYSIQVLSADPMAAVQVQPVEGTQLGFHPPPQDAPTPMPTTTATPTWSTKTTMYKRKTPPPTSGRPSVTTRGFPGSAPSSPPYQPGAATGRVTTRGRDEQTMSHDVTTLVPSVSHMAMGMGIKLIVGGAIAGAFIVIVVIICVGVCVGRRKKPGKRGPRDLGYMVHANMAIHDKLDVNAGSLRHPPPGMLQRPYPNRNSSRVLSTSPSNALTDTDAKHLSSGEHSAPHLAALRRSARPAYNNAADRKRKSHHSRKSLSLTTLTANLEGSSEWLNDMAGTPYAVSDAFACFPRWADNPRGSDATSRYDLLTSTLPAKLNKKPMPLPKPRRTPSDASISPYATNPISPYATSSSCGVHQLGRTLTLDDPGLGTTSDDSVSPCAVNGSSHMDSISPYATSSSRGVHQLGRTLTLDDPGLGTTSDDSVSPCAVNGSSHMDSISPYVTSSSLGLHKASSSMSIDNPGFGTTSSTDALYAVPNKPRRKKLAKDNVILENEMYKS